MDKKVIKKEKSERPEGRICTYQSNKENDMTREQKC